MNPNRKFSETVMPIARSRVLRVTKMVQEYSTPSQVYLLEWVHYAQHIVGGRVDAKCSGHEKYRKENNNHVMLAAWMLVQWR